VQFTSIAIVTLRLELLSIENVGLALVNELCMKREGYI
jgi:hypothetical protein